MFHPSLSRAEVSLRFGKLHASCEGIAAAKLGAPRVLLNDRDSLASRLHYVCSKLKSASAYEFKPFATQVLDLSPLVLIRRIQPVLIQLIQWTKEIMHNHALLRTM